MNYYWRNLEKCRAAARERYYRRGYNDKRNRALQAVHNKAYYQAHRERIKGRARARQLSLRTGVTGEWLEVLIKLIDTKKGLRNGRKTNAPRA